VENLTVGAEDFDTLPVFADFGGWSKANKDFGGKLADLLSDVNSAVAARVARTFEGPADGNQV
jgi:hypothetical protein